MMTEAFVRDIERIVGKQHVSVARTTSEVYSYDASLVKGEPGMVVIPADEQEVAQVEGGTGVGWVMPHRGPKRFARFELEREAVVAW